MVWGATADTLLLELHPEAPRQAPRIQHPQLTTSMR
jgi:hypothetical protein